ncbi:MAG: ergothioneine biosynthesis protein EgtB [Rhodocyclaceae bacterium]
MTDGLVPDSQWASARAAREAGPTWLATALQEARSRSLALLAAWEDALGADLLVACCAQLNPPLWEAGHVGWFQDWWIARNRQRRLGIACDPDHERPAGRMVGADALYDSSRVAHAARWQLALPSIAATRAYLEAGLAQTLELLARTPETQEESYFFRLVLFHEDMHAEAGTYMAQALGVSLPPALRPGEALLPASRALRVPGREWRTGYEGPGFAFDNELPPHPLDLPAFEIDSVPVSWERYLPFVESGGYRDARLWSPEGWQWREANRIDAPRYLRRLDGAWQRRLFGRWQALPVLAPAVHLSWFEADAWCRWAGRRLPGEAEWECAALADARFLWGHVWEWTASPFLPYPGFSAHPYRDYSRPWFGTRRVLRGASRATSGRMAHPRYRNFFTPERNDLHAGFRSCAV